MTHTIKVPMNELTEDMPISKSLCDLDMRKLCIECYQLVPGKTKSYLETVMVRYSNAIRYASDDNDVAMRELRGLVNPDTLLTYALLYKRIIARVLRRYDISTNNNITCVNIDDTHATFEVT